MDQTPSTLGFSPTDLRLLRIFQAVVRHEGFAAAQDDLGLTPSTISNHINHLEARFGVRLCERGRKGFSLTQEGVRIHEAAESLLRSIENFAGIVGSVRGELTGIVHLGTVDAMHTNSAAPLHRALAQFSSLAPKVLLHVEISSPQDLLQRLLDGRYSVILTPINEMHPSVSARPLFDEEQRLYCGRKHPLYVQDATTSAAIVRRYPYTARTYMKDSSHAADATFNHRAMASHMEALAILITSGNFLGHLPTHFAQSFVDSGEMKSLLDDEMAYLDTFYLAHRKDERNRATALLSKCLIDALETPTGKQ